MKQSRDTRQRTAIRRAFESTRRPLSPKEVLDIASVDVPNLGIATVYRNIRAMVEANDLEVVEIPGQSARYQLPQFAKRHLFVCEPTGRVFTFDFDQEKLNLKLPEGFNAESVQLVCYGSADKAAEIPLSMSYSKN